MKVGLGTLETYQILLCVSQGHDVIGIVMFPIGNTRPLFIEEGFAGSTFGI